MRSLYRRPAESVPWRRVPNTERFDASVLARCKIRRADRLHKWQKLPLSTLGLAAPPSGGVDDHRRRDPSGGVRRLGAPTDDSRVHQADPREQRGGRTPHGRSAEAAVDRLGDDGRDHEHEKQKAVAKALHGRPVDGPRVVEKAQVSSCKSRPSRTRSLRGACASARRSNLAASQGDCVASLAMTDIPVLNFIHILNDANVSGAKRSAAANCRVERPCS